MSHVKGDGAKRGVVSRTLRAARLRVCLCATGRRTAALDVVARAQLGRREVLVFQRPALVVALPQLGRRVAVVRHGSLRCRLGSGQLKTQRKTPHYTVQSVKSLLTAKQRIPQSSILKVHTRTFTHHHGRLRTPRQRTGSPEPRLQAPLHQDPRCDHDPQGIQHVFHAHHAPARRRGDHKHSVHRFGAAGGKHYSSCLLSSCSLHCDLQNAAC